MPDDSRALLERSRAVLGTTQGELGKMLRVSRRTVQRWTDGGVPRYMMGDLARLVFPRDPALAERILATAGTTLQAQGLVAKAPPPAPPPPARLDGEVDAVVCAAADAMDLTPKQVRVGLLAAFARAAEIGLTVEAVERTLRAALLPAAQRKPRAGRRARASTRP